MKRLIKFKNLNSFILLICIQIGFSIPVYSQKSVFRWKLKPDEFARLSGHTQDNADIEFNKIADTYAGIYTIENYGNLIIIVCSSVSS